MCVFQEDGLDNFMLAQITQSWLLCPSQNQEFEHVK